ncbi:MAG TPA: PAS domain S-box protein [Pirellulales bacterium]|nr:PAS domain S-box protein [Pirellulales bacterium]
MIQEQAEWLLETLSGLDTAVITSDVAGNVVHLNRSAEAVTGWTHAEAVGTPLTRVFEIVNSETQAPIESPWDRALREGVVVGLANHTVLIAKSGERRLIDDSASPLHGADGQITGVMLVFRDVTSRGQEVKDATERREHEERVKHSELRYRRLFETAKDGILILDAGSGTIVDANPFMCGLLGYEHDEFLGKEIWQIGMFGDIEASRIAYKELRERGYVRYEHLPLKTKAGRQVEVEFVSNVYSVADRQVIQCNIRDITERSQLERKTLEQAKALADLHRRKDEFLAMLSHELRNPLAVTSNAIQLLALDAIEDPIQKRARAMIERQVMHLTHLVDDLLEISRISTGRIRLDRTRLEIKGVVEQAVEACRPLFDRRRHELSVSLPAEPIWLDADPTRLEQIVVNLLSNAAKYTDEGGRIWLSVRPEAGVVALCVRDAGIGIAADVLPHIFELFSQADRSLERSEGGLGIGLSLVRRLAELHGGTVEAKSAGLGHGSEFTVRLPIQPAAAQPGLPAAAAAPAAAAKAQRVLVVDDNVDIADSTAMLLEKFGHDVRTAHSGPAALEVARAFLPDLILMDIGLPGLNGYEVAQRIRQDPRINRVWLVAVTGYARATDVKLAEEAGFDSHLAKPLDIRRIQEILAALCR